jgi:hypothetical protein
LPKELSRQSKIDRKLASRSLYYLCKEILGYRDMVPHVHGLLCDFLTNPIYGRFRQGCIPRSWFKTWVGTIGGAIWLTLPDEDSMYSSVFPYKGPNVRLLIASNISDNSEKMIDKIRHEWMENDRLCGAFPEIVPAFSKVRWSYSCAVVNRPGKFTEGTYTSVGVGGGVISQHFDHILEDDLVYAKKDDFSGVELMPNQEDIDKAIGWHKLAFSLLVDPKHSGIWNIGTRWAPKDLVNHIRENERHYTCFELAVTRFIDLANGMKTAFWPATDNSDCIWPERYDIEALELIEATQGHKIFECFPAGSPILYPDWTCAPIENVMVGDTIVGFSKGSGKGKSRLEKVTVTLVENQVRDVVKITLESGKIIRCTADHPWYTGRHDKTHRPYMPAYVGGKLLSVYDLREPSQEEILDYRYLAGLIDGEGACNHGSIAIGQSKVANPDVYEGIERILQRLRIPYKVSKVNPNDTHILRNKEVRRGLGESFVLGGGRQVKADIIRFGKPAKAERILRNIWAHPYMPIKGEDKVVSIEADGTETVYAIGTSSGNYVAYGYATKNTQYLNRPRAAEDTIFEVEKVRIHESVDSYPDGLRWITYADLAGWRDSKRTCNNVVLTAAKSKNDQLYIARVDYGKFNPSDIIEVMRSHALQFGSKVLIEEVGYQAALRHFVNKSFEEGKPRFLVEALKFDQQKNAKMLRIQRLQPYVNQCALHVVRGMKLLMQELTDYPYSQTCDILDLLGFAAKSTTLSDVGDTPVEAGLFAITRESLEKECLALAKTNRESGMLYPFSAQVGDLNYQWRMA